MFSAKFYKYVLKIARTIETNDYLLACITTYVVVAYIYIFFAET
jgi:hypothetical protein